MRAVVQRCKSASVIVDDQVVGEIGHGLLVLLAVTHEDEERDARYLSDKLAGLRIFEDDHGKMNRSVIDTGGQILSVSQFTLYGDTRKGRRPSFIAAAKPEQASLLYERFNTLLREQGIGVQTGRFGADMDVTLTNWGPVTLIVNSRE